MNRRGFLKTTAAATALVTLPFSLAAKPTTKNLRSGSASTGNAPRWAGSCRSGPSASGCGSTPSSSPPRHAFATWDQQGYVPCEYHLLRWILTGRRPNIKQD